MRDKNGFTMIELLVVVSIIGLLSTFGFVAFNSARVKSRDAQRLTDIKRIQHALDLYYNQKGQYPIKDPAIILGETGSVGASLSLDNGFSVSPAGTVYLDPVPHNPESGGTDYRYLSSFGDTYSITYRLEADGLDYTASPGNIR